MHVFANFVTSLFISDINKKKINKFMTYCPSLYLEGTHPNVPPTYKFEYVENNYYSAACAKL